MMPLIEPSPASLRRFGAFELDLRSGELRKDGARAVLQEQPFQILKRLLEKPGELVTRDELRQALWPEDTFVDFEHSLNAAIKRLRDALGDSADAPRYVETIPRRGYRLVAPVVGHDNAPIAEAAVAATAAPERKRWPTIAVAVGALMLSAISVYLVTVRLRPTSRPQRTLTRLTFEPGFQQAPTWSPDGRFIAYGTQDVWVRPVAGGNPVQVTKHPARDWQPDWSPDGTQIVFRSERDGGGLFVVPVLGGHERRLTSFGHWPQWAPEGSQVLFFGSFYPTNIYTVSLDGRPPREVASAFSTRFDVLWAAWHPDGRISVWGRHPQSGAEFWTLPGSGGTPVQSVLAPEVERQYKDARLQRWVYDFAWAPSGDAIFFSAEAREVRNVWKVRVDSRTLRWTSGPEQLTVASGDYTQLAVSPDGKRLAFNAEARVTRLWVFPFDAVRGQVHGGGQPLTAPGANVGWADLSADGSRLAWLARRRGEQAGRYEVWERRFDDGSERLLVADTATRDEVRWSPDATHLAYGREGALTILDTRTGQEHPLTSASGRTVWVSEWSPDGRSILGMSLTGKPPRYALWSFPVSRDGRPTGSAQIVASSPDYSIFQADVSPDGRWICFEAVDAPDSRTSALYVISRSGGPWVQVTDGKWWDDKPRWSPDGRKIYFLSNRGADAFFLDLWGIDFDPDHGRVLRGPVEIANAAVPRHVMVLEEATLTVAPDRLVAGFSSRAGNVWMLDNIDR